ncbi:DUF6817 domain-containing protein [Streptomyces sp. NPDC050674]|uniref:DUF6817 domain-containing protein n=1 Tax=Streptomyces sp. NPDC050674 TaxID=3157216 RepID=UPI0034228AFF
MTASHAESGPAVALLSRLGAADMDHPGGTLLAHLTRVRRQLAAWGARPFRDRFTGLSHSPEPQSRRDFAELSAASEIDLARLDPALRDRWGPELLSLFTRIRPLPSRPAWSDCREVLAG